jgi:hypothetical protein
MQQDVKEDIFFQNCQQATKTFDFQRDAEINSA